MPRAFIMVLDSFGIGGAPDAGLYGDAGSSTLLHIAEHQAAAGTPLQLPQMNALGLGLIGEKANGRPIPGLPPVTLAGAAAIAAETSKGKDTPSGHWEIAGVPVSFDWGYFPQTKPCFPPELIAGILAEAGLTGILGDCPASGTAIIAELGAEHMRTGKPIFYTSADSVLQIAAHEVSFGLDRLYALCEVARRAVDPYNIGRVIARPFVGENAESFTRTGNRRDYAVPPPEPTLLTRVEAAGHRVLAVGKIGDIFAHQNTTEIRKADGNDALFDAALKAIGDARDGDLVFANFVDFDSSFGHRRDIAGYAGALEAFDRRLPEMLARLEPDDLLLLTADHGCDPSWRGTDHTRECVPVLIAGPRVEPGFYGTRPTFADIGETVARWLALPAGPHGTAFLP